MICKDGVVLASETKSTLGYLVASKESEKILQLADHIAMTIAGASGDAESLARYMKAELKLFEIENQRKISIKGAATLLANILQGSKFYPYYVQLIVAGYDSTGPKIFTLDPLGSVEEEKRFFSTGSGSPIALGVLEDAYKEGMTVDEASKLAIRAIKSAIERDIGSGGRAIDVAVITKDGVKITRHEMDKLPK
ncbi:MAG: archaeal proteasome endopeptidase complex subunit beta [Candidatus Aenigmarchaeota archaeon]|nr:archaeal proteasome endopeptidase complex subunit beta [Candidatus Aenigmarchaeota archaeon]